MTTTTAPLPRTPLLALQVTGLLLAGVGIVTLFVLIGAMIAPGLVDRLTDPTNTDVFVGTATQIIGLLVALGSGVIAFVRLGSTERSSHETRGGM